jgi:hypothetical protein
MTDTNPRDLIQRLADALHDVADDVEGWGNYASSYFQEKHDLSGNVARIHAQAEEARAYLAQPESEGPTDEELLATAAASIEPYQDSGIAIGEYEPETEQAVEAYGSELIDFARAVLARWGQ